MARIRRVEIRNFRSLKAFDWYPKEGVNCLIGPGDSGKSTVLEAIDLCLGARRSLVFTDVDFNRLDYKGPINISVTLGELPQALKSIEDYGDYLRGFVAPDELVDEPKKGHEPVLTVQLLVEADMEPRWRLYSDRTAAAQTTRMLRWKERLALAPAKIGAYTSSNLAWGRGSVLNRLSEERADVGAELFEAARKARDSFGDAAEKHLEKTLETVTRTAKELGVSVGSNAKALLDAHSASFGDGAISLHDDTGVPLRSLGAGSARLLVAGLHRAAADASSIVISDEVEIGLEPHRIVLFLKSLGAKDTVAPLQCFLTTHSPVVVRELSSAQLFVLRQMLGAHQAHHAAGDDDIQRTLRAEPEAFLAKSILVCEGASEKGFVRGLDRFWMSQGALPLEAHGLACVNVAGGKPDQAFKRASSLQKLGYRVAVLLDHDKGGSEALISSVVDAGGAVFRWTKDTALEDALFIGLPAVGVTSALQMACLLNGESTVDDHIKSKSDGHISLAGVRQEGLGNDYSLQTRKSLGQAARTKDSGWFKEEWRMDKLAHDVIGPNLGASTPQFRKVVSCLADWARSSA